jgi:peptidylprolyl isomerase
MTELVRINEEIITADDLVKVLKLSGRFDSIIEEIVREKITVHVARKSGIEISVEEIQERADQIRRVRGLHRSVDMNRWLNQLGVDLDDLEQFIKEMLYYEKMQENIVTDVAVDDYFSLHAPEFDCIVVSHIIVDSEGKAREILALAEEESDMFGVLAREHSLADTASEAGYIGVVMRGNLHSDVEAKVFHAEEGEVLGPFPAPDGSNFEIFMINEKRNASLDSDTTQEIRRKIKDEWMVNRAAELQIELR